MTQFLSDKKSTTELSIRGYQLTEKRFVEARNSAHMKQGAGLACLLIVLSQLGSLLDQKEYLIRGLIILLFLVIGYFCFTSSSRSMKLSLDLQKQAEDERQLSNELTEWFITTYSADQIDHQVDAISTLSGNPEILCLKRLDMIRILIDREYDRTFDDIFMDQICEDLYNMIYEDGILTDDL